MGSLTDFLGPKTRLKLEKWSQISASRFSATFDELYQCDSLKMLNEIFAIQLSSQLNHDSSDWPINEDKRKNTVKELDEFEIIPESPKAAEIFFEEPEFDKMNEFYINCETLDTIQPLEEYSDFHSVPFSYLSDAEYEPVDFMRHSLDEKFWHDYTNSTHIRW